MDVIKKLTLLAFFFFVLAPALTLIHELGHALVPLLEGEQVTISIGGSAEPAANAGQLSILYVSAWKPWAGFTNWSGDRDIVRLALGPLTSLALGVLFFFLLKYISNKNVTLLLKLSIFWVLCGFLITAFPFSYPKFILQNPTDASDGKQILQILRSEP